jgi:tRNA(His) guanylyltransferase
MSNAEKDQLGDRMKSYEAIETGRKFDSTLPVYARIDGRGFNKFTKNMNRPFDERMTRTMVDTTKYLVDKTHAAIGYVQSDEISLAWNGTSEGTKLFFDGKIQKTCSVLASMAAARFALAYHFEFHEWSYDMPHFDCRVFQMPSQTEVANMFLWREFDAQKNSISMLARHHFSHKDLQGKSGDEMIVMMAGKGVDMSNLPVSFRRGSWVQRVTGEKFLTKAEYDKIPEKHRVGIDLTTPVMRSWVKVLDMPPFVTVANREDVIFRD